MSFHYFHIIPFLLSACLTWAQEPFHNPVHLTPAEGLSHACAYDFEEDEHGFIWIGTYGGLCRFDGSNVLPVHHDGPTLRVHSLQRLGDTLWIGAFDGAAWMDLRTGHIEDFPIYKLLSVKEADDRAVREMYQDRQGYLWMAPAHQGFVRLDPATGQFRHFPLPPAKAIPGVHSVRDKYSLRQIVQDVKHDSIFWGISFCDLVKLDTGTGKIKRFRCGHENEEMAYNINRHKSMHAHTDGKIYLGSWERGLSIFDPSTESYTIPFENAYKDWRRQLNKEHLHGIFPKDEREIYLTYSSGLYLYNVEEQSVKVLQNNVFNPFVRQDYGVSFRDSAGRLWNSLSKNGVQLFDPMVNQYAYFPLDTLNKTEDMFLLRDVIENFYPGYLTLSGQYSDGLYHLNPSTGHAFKTPPPREHMANHKYFQSWGAAQISPDELMVSEIRGLHYYKKGLAEMQRFPIQPGQKYHSLGPVVFDGNKCLWNGSFADGLWMLDLSLGKVQNHTQQIGQPRISGLFKDSRGNIWFRFHGGHAVLPEGQTEFSVFHYKNDTLHTLPVIEDFCECPNGEIWVAANAAGIAQLSPNGVMKVMPFENSPGPEQAFRITCDPDNNLWIKGNSHLIFFDREQENMSKYSYDYGLSKVDGLIRFLQSGQLLIGSREGVYIVNPDHLRTNQSAPKPYISSIRTKRGAKGKLEDFLNIKLLKLPHDENALTIEFAAINFTLPESTQFRYKLEGSG